MRILVLPGSGALTSPVLASQGGTGITSYTTGDLLYASGATSFGRLEAVGVGSILVSNGVAAGPIYSPSPVLTTSLTCPLSIGGTAVGSTLILRSTSGIGSSDAIIFQVGNNGGTEGGRFTTAGLLSTLAHLITSTSATAFVVGPNGATNPTVSVSCAVASQTGGIAIVGASSGNGVSITSTGVGSNEVLTLNSKGTRGVTINSATANTGDGVRLQNGAVTNVQVQSTNTQFSPIARTSGVTTALLFTGASDTALTAGTEAVDFHINLAQTKQHASNTTVALQRHVLISPPTDTMASATGTITDDSTLAITGPPTGGTNSAITTAEALLIETRALTNVTNGYGMVVNAPSGAATINSAAKFVGSVQVTGILTPISATSVTAGGVVATTLGVSAPSICVGSGAPSLTAAQGSLYLRSDGGATTRAYINTDGGTTWTALVSVA